VSHGLKALLRLAVSAGLLVVLFRVFDAAEIAAHLSRLDPLWVLPALVLSVLQIMLLAWRWRFTAQRLGVGMPYRHALGEYYLGVLLNQVLPGGILGDVSRAWRHAVASARRRTAIHAAVLDRVVVQSVMLTVAVASLFTIPGLRHGTAGWACAGLLGTAAVAIGWLILRGPFPALRSAVREFGADARRALLPAKVLLIQAGTATLVMGANLVLYITAARMLGAETPLATLLPLIAPVLLVMMLPISIAGWGVREGAAAVLWGLSGLEVAEGVAIAVAYGLLFLLAALPGVLPLLRVTLGRARRGAADQLTGAGRDRTGCPDRAQSDGTADAGPRSVSPPRPALRTRVPIPAGSVPPSGAGGPTPLPPENGKR
jgi:glycosyltransferase 2 family protein